MALNPSAEAFVPSSELLLRLLKGSESPKKEEDMSAANQGFSPPQLESLYIEFPEQKDHRGDFDDRSQPIHGAIDYTNFDLPFFFHDMMSADTDDFENYLSDRAEYLLGYASTSQAHAIEIADTILDTVFNLLRKNGREFQRPLRLAAEMCDMDEPFQYLMSQQLIRLINYLRKDPPKRDLAYSVLLGLILRELHIGTCVAPPDTTDWLFSEEVYALYMTLLSDKRSMGAAIFALEQCDDQIAAICQPRQVESICAMLRKICARFSSQELAFKCATLVKRLRQPTQAQCFKPHAMPVAQLNEEESRDFEAFLQESRRNYQHRN